MKLGINAMGQENCSGHWRAAVCVWHIWEWSHDLLRVCPGAPCLLPLEREPQEKRASVSWLLPIPMSWVPKTVRSM